MTVATGGVIFRTTNGGNDWQQSSIGATGLLNDVFFISQTTGWIVGEGGVIYKTQNGGNSWTLQDAGTTNDLFDSYFISESEGWISGYRYILHTNNGGNSWEKQWTGIVQFITHELHGIIFTDNMHGWAVGNKGEALHTKDGGQHWVPQFYPDNNIEFYDMALADDKHGLLVGDEGSVIYTGQIDYLAPWIVTQPVDTFVCEGTLVEIGLQVIGDSLQFQWLKNWIDIPGANQGTLVFDSIQVGDGDLYRCSVFNGAGIVRSSSFQINIKPRLKITGQPQDVTCHVNDTVILNQAVTGALPIHYQWLKNGADIPGAVFHTHSIYSVQLSDSGYYRCVVSNDCNEEITEEAKLTVLPASAIDEQINDQIHLFPNPVNAVIHFDGLNPSHFQYRIFNIYGELVMKGYLPAGTRNELKLRPLPSGLYYITLTSIVGKLSARFIKY